jgi:hypothetical protein
MWSDRTRPRAVVASLGQSLRAADREGLEPAVYRPDDLDAFTGRPLEVSRAVDLEIQASCRYLTYAWHLALC